MAAVGLPAVLQHLRVLAAAGQGNDLSDGQLLHRFAQTRDERAFEALVRRHGPLVHGVCQRILGPGPDRDDAFQATFLVLARKAGSIRNHASMGSWLHGTARRLALRLKFQRVRRQQRERSLGGLEEIALTPTEAVDPVLRASLRELGRILDEEVERLPARQRDVLVLCHLEGLSSAEAARRLGCPPSTLTSRLLKARAVLQQRLRRRGVTLSVTALTLIGAAQAASAALPVSLLRAAVQGGTAYAVRGGIAPAVAPRAALLADQVVPTALLARLPLTLAAVLVLTLLGLAAALRPSPPSDAAGELVAPPGPGVAAQPPVAKSLEGDALPDGASARLGTTRWRYGGLTGFVAFLPNGKRVVSASNDRVFHVWEFPSGKEIRRFGPGVDAPLPLPARWRSTEMPVGLSGDGKLLAFHVHDAEIQLYDVATGKKLATLAQEGQLSNLAISPDGRHVAVRDFVGHLTIWDWKARQAQHIAVPHRFIIGQAPALRYSPDGKLLAMTSNSRDSSTIKVVDPLKAKGEQVRTLQTDQVTYINWVLFAPDSKLLACADRSAVVRLIEVATGKQLGKFQLKERGPGPVGMAFSRDGKAIVTRSIHRQTVSEWDVATGKELRRFGPVGRHDPPHWDRMLPRPALSPDGTILAFAGVDHSLHFLDLAAGKEVHGDGRPTMPLTTVGWRPDGKGLWTQSYGKALRQWDPVTGKEAGPRALPVNVFQAALSADARYLATAPHWEEAGKIISIATGKEVGQVPPHQLQEKLRTPTNMVFSPDGAFLAVRWERAQQLEVYAVPQGKRLHTLGVAATPSEMNVNGLACWPVMAFSADGKLLAAYSAAEVLSVWDTATGRRQASLSLTGNTPFAGTAFTPDGRCLAVENNDGSVALWELATCKQRRVFVAKDARPKGPKAAVAPLRFSIKEPVAAPSANIAFSPRGNLLVYGAPTGDIHVWHVQTGQELAAFRGHTGVINAFAFTADGKTLASASADTTVLTWDLSTAMSRPLPRRVFTDAELKTRWEVLAGEDAQQAFSAMCDLAGAPAQAVALLNQQLQPAPALDLETVNQLIANLGDPTFKVREKAIAALLQLDGRVVPVIDKALAGKPALEVRRRLEKIRDARMRTVLAEEELRSYRAVEVLEHIGTPQARRLLQRLAAGAPGALATTAAREALQRQ
jgi:RNA polymerase sigma factor (sigma-70 family)